VSHVLSCDTSILKHVFSLCVCVCVCIRLILLHFSLTTNIEIFTKEIKCLVLYVLLFDKLLFFFKKKSQVFVSYMTLLLS